MAIQLNHRENKITTGVNAETAGIRLTINNIGSLELPKGTTAQRPATPIAGDFRYNTDSNVLEYYNGSSWITVIAGNLEDLKGPNGEFIVDGVTVGPTAANYTQIYNATTGNNVKIAAAGTDTNVGMTLETKGTGTFTFSNGGGTILTLASGGPANITIEGHPTTPTIRSSNNLSLRAENLNVQASSVAINLTSTTGGNFTVGAAGNTGLTVDVSGANGILLEAGGNEAKLQTSGDLFINSTGGDIRLGNGSNQALVIDANTPGQTLTLQTLATSLNLSTGQTMTFNANVFEFSNKRLTNVANPTQPSDAATKQYVDAAIAGLDWKQSVRAATTGNITLSGEQTVDGVALVSGNRVLVKNQTNAAHNGIYVVRSGAWVRAEDADQDSEVTAGLAVFVEEGTTNADTGWVLVTNDPIVVSSTNLTFTQFTGAASLNVVGDAGITVNLTGNTYTITADTDETTITNGGGPSGKLSVYANGVLAGQVLRAPAGGTGVAQWGALDLANTNAVTGVLDETNGGTGESTYAQGDILVGDASNKLTKRSLGTAGQFLRSNGTTLVYASASINDINEFSVTGAVAEQVLKFNGTRWVNGAVNLANNNAVTGILPVPRGGTGLGTVTSGSLVYGDGTSAFKTLPIGTASTSNLAYVLKTNTAGDAPEWGTITLNQLSNVNAPTPAANDVLQFNGTQWVPASLGSVDKFVRVSNNDTTSGYLSDKLVAATNGALQFTIANPSGDEDYVVSVRVDNTTVRINSGNNLAVGNGANNQVLIGQGASNDAVWSYLNTLRNSSGNALFTVNGTNVSGAATLSAGVNSTDLTVGGGDFNIIALSGNIRLNGVRFPSPVPERSVLVANTNNVLIALQAAATHNQLLQWNVALSAFEFIDTSAVAGNSFAVFSFNGNASGGNLVADSASDTLTVSAGVGITLVSEPATDKVNISFSRDGMTDVAVQLVDTLPYFDSSNSNKPEYRSFQNVFSDLDVPFNITSNGLLTRTANDTYASRTIVASTADNKLGISVVNGDGVAGNPTIGLDIIGLTAITSASPNDQLVVFSSNVSANRKVTVSDLFKAFDRTRINDAANTTYVDTDENASTVDIVAAGGQVAKFVNGVAGSAQFFRFDTGTSSNTIRLEAAGTSTNIDIRLMPKGNGQIYIGETGHGVIQADDTYNLALMGGENGGNLILRGGSTSGVVRIQDPTSAEFVAFNGDHSVVYYANGTTNAKVVDYVLTGITTDASANGLANIPLDSDSTAMFEAYVVGREQTATSSARSVGYRVRGVVTRNASDNVMIVDSFATEILAEGGDAVSYDTDFVAVSAVGLRWRAKGAATHNVRWTAFVKVIVAIH